MPGRRAYADAEDYDGGKYGKKARKDDTPWALLTLLVVATAGAAYTRRRSLAVDGGAPPSRQLRERPVDAPATPLEQPFPADRHQPLVTPAWRVDAAKQADAEAAFNPKLHALYTALPPLQPLSEYLLNGGWRFTDAVYDYAAHHPAAEVVSWDRPRAVLFRSFLRPEEVGHMIAVANDNLERSTVLATEEADEVMDVRTSFGSWPPDDEVTDAITERIHRLVGIPKPFGEGLYVLNYKLGEKYDSHHDNCVEQRMMGAAGEAVDEACMGFLRRAGGPDCGPGAGGDSCGDRIATFILHLSAPQAGGRTVFPSAAATDERRAAAGLGRDEGDEWYCTREHVLGVAPRPGDATLFFDYIPTGGSAAGSHTNRTAAPAALPVDEALHSGCPVLVGEKWIATRWIRASRFV